MYVKAIKEISVLSGIQGYQRDATLELHPFGDGYGVFHRHYSLINIQGELQRHVRVMCILRGDRKTLDEAEKLFNEIASDLFPNYKEKS